MTDIWRGTYADIPASVQMVGSTPRAFLGERMVYGEDEIGIFRRALAAKTAAETPPMVVIAEKYQGRHVVRLNLRDPINCRVIHEFGVEAWAAESAATINQEIADMLNVASSDPLPSDRAGDS